MSEGSISISLMFIKILQASYIEGFVRKDAGRQKCIKGIPKKCPLVHAKSFVIFLWIHLGPGMDTFVSGIIKVILITDKV